MSTVPPVDFDKQGAREICEKATPGPWRVSIANGYEHIWRFVRCNPPTGRSEDTYIAGTTGRRKDGIVAALSCETVIEEACNDASFIAEARTLLPAALDRIDELESLNNALMENCNGLRTRAQNAEAYITELENHERQTHEILGSLLGKDDSLEEGAKRLLAENALLLEALIEERRTQAEADQ